MLQLSQPLPPNDLCHRAEGGKTVVSRAAMLRGLLLGGLKREFLMARMRGQCHLGATTKTSHLNSLLNLREEWGEQRR